METANVALHIAHRWLLARSARPVDVAPSSLVPFLSRGCNDSRGTRLQGLLSSPTISRCSPLGIARALARQGGPGQAPDTVERPDCALNCADRSANDAGSP
jgi:hypothetical protein